MFSKKVMSVALLTVLSSWTTPAYSAAFESCPTHAFLMQGAPAKLYSVDLATGFTATLSSDLGTTDSLNGVAFNVHDDYLYGYSKEFGNVMRIHSDYSLENLNISNMPNTNFYVGDISLTENTYYFYRPGASFGLYRASLDDQHADYLNAIRIIDGASLNISIYDFAIHPANNGLYAVDKQGNLHLIDVVTGGKSTLGNVGVTGVFGAAYFDEKGTLYISRNSDGHIYRIKVTEANPSAEFFAAGPLSSKNDGARCGIASLIGEESTIDFGDAPDSYGTSLDNNGARHNMTDSLYLGVSVGGDDNGVTPVTGFEQSMDAAVQVEAQGTGYLNVWADWDQDGSFDSKDHEVVDQLLNNGSNIVVLDVPADAELGQTWLRARYSSTQGIGPTGGVSDGEVEDIQIMITEQGTSVISYPGSNEYTTLAFEDKWPELGDYDMNDVVMAYRTHKYISDNKVTRYVIEGHILALGASFRNGFAIQLDDIDTANIDQAAMRYELNGVQQQSSALEVNSAGDDAVLIVSDNLWNHLTVPGGCTFYRSEKGCDAVGSFSFYISAPLVDPVSQGVAPSNVLNPFIFATPNIYHGVGTSPGRGLEIHLKNKRVSAQFNNGLWGLADDRSSYPQSSFVSASGMPWALELPSLWDHPVEKTDLVDAYPEFVDYVQSLGTLKRGWYLSPASEKKVIFNF